MKSATAFLALASLAGAALAGSAAVAHKEGTDGSPVVKVLGLIRDLKVGVEYDGKKEQKTYDKYACWCEATLDRKAKNIADAKEKIAKLSEHILKLKGEIGSHGAEISSLTKWIAENGGAQKDATELRDKENAAFETAKMDNEQCIGALEGAIKTLTGAGGGKAAGFLELRQAQLMTAAQDMRRVLANPTATRSASTEDLALVSRFLENPADFAADPRRVGVISAVQTDLKNPNGEYAPASTQIQGILKGMYDAFTADLEKDNAVEADKQKGYEAYMDTKKKELASLQETLETQELDKATKEKDQAYSQTERDDTQEQLAEDESYFELTKQTCREKAVEWNERSRLRAEELAGITKAIEILESPQATQNDKTESEEDKETEALLQHTGARRVMSLLQLARASTSNLATRGGTSRTFRARKSAYARLARVAAKFSDVDLAQIAAEVRAGGHFDKVIKMMDEMIEVLRKEEASDIKHRDLCQNSVGKNNADMADSQHSMDNAAATITELTEKVKAIQEDINQLDRDSAQTNTDMEERLEMRNNERAYFEYSIKDDVIAMDTINKAMQSLTAYYKKNKLPLLVQQGPGPEYTVDSDKAPEVDTSSDRSDQTAGLISILEMIVTDIQNEVDTARKEDALAEEAYEKEKQALVDLLHAQKASKVSNEQAISDAETKIGNNKGNFVQSEEELKAQKSLAVTLATDCDWVAKEFDSRRTKRKAEIEGLHSAKAILAGASTGDSGSLDELAVDSAQ